MDEVGGNTEYVNGSFKKPMHVKTPLLTSTNIDLVIQKCKLVLQ